MKLFSKYIWLLFFVISITLKAQQTGTTTVTDDPSTNSFTVMPASDYKDRDEVDLVPTGSNGEVHIVPGSTQSHLFVDPSIILNTSYNVNGTNGTSWSTALNTSLPVGSTAGSYAVSNGAAFYNMPIIVPPGTAGMTPSISIQYNSSSDKGLVGLGWNLSGISSISRVNKNIYHNNIAGPINLDANDVFSLDGNRLIATSASNSYVTENENFSVITYIPGSGSMGDYFKVQTKDGKTMEYGNSLDSKIQLFKTSSSNSVSSVTSSWYITKMYDNYGNTILYNYISDPTIISGSNAYKEIAISEIDYTLNSQVNPQIPAYNSIKFNYETRTDINSGWLLGNVMGSTLILREIEVNCESVFMKKYEFNYGSNNIGESYLNEIKEYGSDNSNLNSTVIDYFSSKQMRGGDFTTYGGGIDGVFPVAYVSSNVADYRYDYRAGDFNGDGRADLIGFEYTLSDPTDKNSIKNYSGNYSLKINNDYGATYTEIATGSFKLPLYDFILGNAPYSWEKVLNGIVDVNGDGMDDLILYGNYGTSTLKNDITSVYLSNGHGFTKTAFDFTEQTYSDFQFTVADVNGDKLPEVIAFDNGTPDVFLTPGLLTAVTQITFNIYDLQTGNKYTTTSFQNLQTPTQDYNTGQYMTSGLTPVDVDGDGASEFFAFYQNSNTNIDFYYLTLKPVFTTPGDLSTLSGVTEVGTTVHNMTKKNSGDQTFPNDQLLPCDYNGDGLTDLIDIADHSSWIFLGTSQAGLFGGGFEINNLSVGYADDGFKFLTADANHDGKSDLILLDATDNTVSGMNIGVAYGNGFIGQSTLNPSANKMVFAGDFHGSAEYNVNFSWTSGGGFDPRDYTTEFLVGDFLGNGEQDIMYKPFQLFSSGGGTYGIYRSIINPDIDASTHYISSIRDGLANTIAFTYNNISQIPPPGTSSSGYWTNPIYSIQNPQTFPLTTIQKPINVVQSVIVPDGIGYTNKTTYTYNDAIVHQQGLGFFGFGKVTENNYVFKSGSYQQNSQIIKTSNIITSGNIIDFVLGSLTQTIYNSASGALTSTSLSNYKIFPQSYSGSGLEHFTGIISKNETDYTGANTLTTYVYDNNPTNPTNDNVTTTNININGGLETQTITKTYCTYTDFTFIPSLVQTIKTDINRSGLYSRETDYTYTDEGNVKTIKQDPGAQEVNTVYTYYPAGQINTTSISSPDPFVQGVSSNLVYTYDTKFRFLATLVNSGLNNQTTNYSYDPKWGKPIAVTGVDNLTTYSEYDAYGRNIKVTTPDGLTNTTSYDWITSAILAGWTSDPIDVTPYALIKVTTAKQGSPSISTFSDQLGRTVKTISNGFAGTTLNQVNTYDNLGNLFQQSSVYDNTGTNKPLVTTYTYDNLARLNDIVQTDVSGDPPITANCQYSYSGGNTSLTLHLNSAAVDPNDARIITKQYDATGLLVSSGDDATTLSYTYGGHHMPIKVELGSNGAITEIQYDAYGRKTSLWEANSGTTTYQYNAYGQLYYQFDNIGAGHKYTYTYDAAGRTKNILSQAEGGSYVYDYVPLGTNGVNKLQKVTGPPPNNLSCVYTYDGLNRLIQVQEDAGAPSPFITKYDYDQFNNISKITYPGGFAVTKNYDPNGYLEQIKRADNGKSIWQTNIIDVFGNFSNYKLGNNINVQKTFTDFGYTSNFKAQNGSNIIQDYDFSFNNINGDLKIRTENTHGFSENFSYDKLDRLFTVRGATTLDMGYDPSGNGNIMSKSDVGTYTYDPIHINQVTQIDNTTGNISTNSQVVDYNSFKKASVIKEIDITNNNNIVNELDLTYGPDQKRCKTDLFGSGGTLIKTTYYQNNYEKIVSGANTNNFTETNYINGGDGLCAMYVKDQSGTGNLYYIFTDYLGSILKLTDENGNTVTEQSFDAWGKPRDPNSWTSNAVSSSIPGLIRGYTGHEYLQEFDLINMNGRVYDPINARMLSVDNDVTDDENTQSYNRYSYCLNNPLKYTDPTGNYYEVQWGMDDGNMNPIYDWAGERDANEWEIGFDENALSEISAAESYTVPTCLDCQSVPQIDQKIIVSLPTVVITAPTYASTIDDGTGTPDADRYPGINIYNVWWMPEGAGVTLPPFGIFVGPNTSQAVQDHEFGHFLEYKKIGGPNFYAQSGLPSVWNEIEGTIEKNIFGGRVFSVNHANFRTETDANTYKQKYFGPKAPSSNERWPTNDNTKSSQFTWYERLGFYALFSNPIINMGK